MVFVFAVHHGARHAVASFSMAHQIGAAAWPVALVLMALLEVSTRIAIVQLRGRQRNAVKRRSRRRGCMTIELPDHAPPARTRGPVVVLSSVLR